MNDVFCKGAFWDFDLTWNTTVPLFTTCFEDAVFIFFPYFLFSVILFINLCCLSNRQTFNPLPWTCLNATKLALSVSLLLISISLCGFRIHKIFEIKAAPLSSLLSSYARVLVFGLLIAVQLRQRVCGIATSTSVCLLWICFTICGIIVHAEIILKYFILDIYQESKAIFLLKMFYYPIIYAAFVLSLFPETNAFHLLEPNRSFMSEIPFLVYITFFWFNKTIYKSTRKILTVYDFPQLSIQLTASYVHKTFSSRWKYHSLTGIRHSWNLAWNLIRAFWPWVLKAVFLEVAFTLTMVLPPVILNQILIFVEDKQYAWRGYLYAIVLSINRFAAQMLRNNYEFLLYCASCQLKSSLIGTMFSKVLRMSVSTRKDYSSGALTGLISVDVERIALFTQQCAYLIVASLKIVVIVYMMWQYLGPACLAGVGVILTLVLLAFYTSRISARFLEKQMVVKDTRLKYMSEILNGIKVLKLYAWEVPLTEKIAETRKKEIKLIRTSLLCNIVTYLVLDCSPFLVAFASFATFVFMDTKNILTPTRAFVSLNLMDQLRGALFKLPETVSQLIQTSVSVKRLEDFLTTEDSDPNVVGSTPDEGDVLTLKKVSLSWTNDSECVLKDIDLHVRKRHLVAVVGPVGSGKSSLMSAVLGEMHKIKGSIDLQGSVAYVPQQAWILNRSLKENVLLVKHMKEERYHEVLESCCLIPDLEVLPEGDETEIGEKGVNLSGGQKQRVSLARAVYQDKEIYLLDDPLSAVDVHVRKSLFNDVIGNEGLLKNKSRILVTHDVSVLPKVDLIVSMKDGKIEEIGSYHDLLERRGSFADFVAEHAYAQITGNVPSSELLANSVESKAYRGIMSLEATRFWEQKEDFDHEKRKIKLMKKENMEVGGVKRRVYWDYVKSGTLLLLPATIGFLSFAIFDAATKVWLSKWTNGESTVGPQNLSYTVWYLSGFGLLGFFETLFVIVGSTFLVYGVSKASEKYHNCMLSSIMKSPMTFFDSTPMGRIVNRFGSDIDVLDTQLINTFHGCIFSSFTAICSFAVISYHTALFLPVLLLLGIAYYILLRLQLNASRQIKRLEATTRSPINSQFMEAIEGVSSIKAYSIHKEFTKELEEKLDTHILCYFNTGACNKWMGFWLGLLSSLIILSVSLIAILNYNALTASVVALLVTYALSVTNLLPLQVRINTELENRSVSIERVAEYCHLKSEAPWTLPHNDPNPEWPQQGQIIFNNYSTRYREDMDVVLKDVNLVVDSNQKVGIVGRTGAGKSSITLALFRIIDSMEGAILIDGIDISKIGLHSLRSKLTIIPQDPVLFTGSIRFNLDPTKEHSDDEIWASLELSNLKAYVASLCGALEHNLEEGGSNLSLGQRQLMCLSRALLKKTKILVLDEATASVDMNTDGLIQNVIRTAFTNHTIITIAHRLETVIDYEKIVVMDNGEVTEVGNPVDLMQDTKSKFYEMSKEAGII